MSPLSWPVRPSPSVTSQFESAYLLRTDENWPEVVPVLARSRHVASEWRKNPVWEEVRLFLDCQVTR